jgi:hypothetical protein
MSRWSYVVDQAVNNGTASATVQFSNDLAGTGIATVLAAGSLPGVAPDVQSAITDVDTVQGDCCALTG